jgi:hypothetical protein
MVGHLGGLGAQVKGMPKVDMLSFSGSGSTASCLRATTRKPLRNLG